VIFFDKFVDDDDDDDDTVCKKVSFTITL